MKGEICSTLFSKEMQFSFSKESKTITWSGDIKKKGTPMDENASLSSTYEPSIITPEKIEFVMSDERETNERWTYTSEEINWINDDHFQIKGHYKYSGWKAGVFSNFSREGKFEMDFTIIPR